jgi:hypothetical protein
MAMGINRRARFVRQMLSVALCTAPVALVAPAASNAAILTVGSPLSVPATLNTAENLGYAGMNTNVPPTPEYPNGVVHTYHFGADSALFNTTLASGQAAMPANGQALKVSLEGCAEQAPGGPAPLTQIHFQTIHPEGSGYRVEISSQGFEIPVCGAGGASGSTVSTYEPVNLCVLRGDYVDFNDEGGFVEHFYMSGVPYEVMGAVPGSTFSSFLKNEGTGNGATLLPSESGAMDGFASNQHEELMLQVQLGTGPDARYVCAGGHKEAPKTLSAFNVHPQTDGINHERIVSVAIYCRPATGCQGNASIGFSGRVVGSTSFNIAGGHTSHVAIRLAASVMKAIRRHHGIETTLSATVGGATITAPVTVKIF